VAAKLASAKEVEGNLLKPEEMVGYDSPLDSNRIIYIDYYGNAMTGINAEDIEENKTFSVKGAVLHYARTFSEVPEGQAFWYRNSMGMVEFAVNRGSAASILKLDLGMKIAIL
jgi:hypothetical protein